MNIFLVAAKATDVSNKIINTDNLVIFILTAIVIWIGKDFYEKSKAEKAKYLEELKKANDELKKTQQQIAAGEKTDISIESRIASIEKGWTEMKDAFISFKNQANADRMDDHNLVHELQKEMSKLIDRRVEPYANSVGNLSSQFDDLKEILRAADKEISSLRGELKSHMQFTVFITMAASKVEQIDPSVSELVRDILEIPKLQELKGLHLAMERERATKESDGS